MQSILGGFDIFGKAAHDGGKKPHKGKPHQQVPHENPLQIVHVQRNIGEGSQKRKDDRVPQPQSIGGKNNGQIIQQVKIGFQSAGEINQKRDENYIENQSNPEKLDPVVIFGF